MLQDPAFWLDCPSCARSEGSAFRRAKHEATGRRFCRYHDARIEFQAIEEVSRCSLRGRLSGGPVLECFDSHGHTVADSQSADAPGCSRRSRRGVQKVAQYCILERGARTIRAGKTILSVTDDTTSVTVGRLGGGEATGLRSPNSAAIRTFARSIQPVRFQYVNPAC
jgi:hypothetical protein